MMMPDLKPCPFCGSKAVFMMIPNSVSGDDIFGNEGGEYIECTRRGCGVSTVLVTAIKEDAKPRLAEMWNRRVASDVFQFESKEVR